MRGVVRLIALLISVSLPAVARTQEPAPRDAQVVATAQGRYVPLQTMRDGRAKMPAALGRRVTVRHRSVLLQNVLLDIANQAGLGLSYSDEVARSGTLVSVGLVGVSAAEALARTVEGTPWAVLVTPQAQVTVVRAERRQVGAITGRVMDAKAVDLPVVGVEVLLEDTRWRTVTDTTGRYRLADVDTGTYTLTARRLGYERRREAVTVVADSEVQVHLAMEPVARKLDELVTTATGPQRLMEIANAVTVLRADSIVQTQPIKDVTDLLQTRVPGLAVLPTTGAPGDPARLRLRGSSSILRSNDPIVIVDGVRIYYEQSARRSASLAQAQAFDARTDVQDAVPAPSPLDRIDPNSIEKVEVLNGPSAATLYGADAANGVIVITTKRGRPGPARWDLSLTYGRSFMPGRFPDTYFGFGRTLRQEFANCSLLSESDFNNERDPTCVVDSVVARQVLNDPELTALGQGHRTEATLSVSGGRPDITYAITGTYNDEVGLLKLPRYEADRFYEAFGRAAEDWMRRPHHLNDWNLTSAFMLRPAQTAKVGLTVSLAGVEQRRSELEEQLAVLRGAYVDKTSGLIDLNSDRDGFVEESDFSLTLVPNFYKRTINRALALNTGVDLQWDPFERFTFHSNAGLAADLRRDEALVPRGLIDQDSLGSLTTAHGTATVVTLNMGVNYQAPLAWGFQLYAAAGVNYTSRSVADIGRSVPDATGGPSTSSQHESHQFRDNLTSYGWYIAPRIGNRRFSLETGLRLDGGSNYGSQVGFDGFALPKLGFSWLISDEPFFPMKNSHILNMLRLRAAYGQAGVQPNATDRLRLYTSRETGELDGKLVGLSRLSTVGNTQLRPERSTEIEGGFDADLLEGRLTVGLTVYRKTKNDALLSMPVAPSVVGSGKTMGLNIGVVRNTGYDLQVSTNLLPMAVPVQWSTSLYLSHNRNVVVSLAKGLEAFYVSNSSFQRIVAGYPLSGYWVRPLLGYADANGDGVLQRDEILLGDSPAYLGAPEPSHTAGLHTTVRLFGGALAANAAFAYQDGFTQQNVAPGGALARAIVDLSAPFVYQALLLAATGSGAEAYGPGGFQTVSTLRFHSLAVTWQLPGAVIRRIGAQHGTIAVQGTNLGLITNYRGKDPLVNSVPVGNEVADRGALPQPREWQVRLSFSH